MPERFTTEEKTFTLEDLYEAIGCDFIEIVRIRNPINGHQICMVVDESGKLKGKRINLRASLLYANGYDYIAGDAIICDEGMTDDGPDLIKFDDVTASVLELFLKNMRGE